jgi:hypothetical protein
MPETQQSEDVLSQLDGIFNRFQAAESAIQAVTHSRYELLFQLAPEELLDILNVPQDFLQYDRLLLPVCNVAAWQAKAARELGDKADAQEYRHVSELVGKLLIESVGITEEAAMEYRPIQQAAVAPVNLTLLDIVHSSTIADEHREAATDEIFEAFRVLDAAELQQVGASLNTKEPFLDQNLRHYVELTARRQARAAAEIGDADDLMSYTAVQADVSDRDPFSRKYNVTGQVI